MLHKHCDVLRCTLMSCFVWRFWRQHFSGFRKQDYLPRAAFMQQHQNLHLPKTEFSVFRRKSTERWWRAAESVCWDLSDLVFQRPWPTTGMGDGKSDLQNVTLDSTKHTIFKNITDLQVFLTEYMGPLLIYLLFYVRVPNIYNHKYTFTSSSHHVVKYVLQKNDLLCSKEEIVIWHENE